MQVTSRVGNGEPTRNPEFNSHVMIPEVVCSVEALVYGMTSIQKRVQGLHTRKMRDSRY
jgi:hypothetical protein